MNLDRTKKYALAVSGGVDSMVMLHRFATELAGVEFFVITVNHGIRPDAEEDCRLVSDYCHKLGVECQIHRINVPQFCKQNKVSEETGARILRYGILEKADCDFVCLAHHAGDNAETVLMHVFRGCGAEGAVGIRPCNGKYVRPMLEMTREQIEQYAAEHNVPFATDSTNADLTIRRNFIRNKIMPLIKEIVPSAEQNIERFAQNIAADNDFLNDLADISQVTFGNDSASIPCELLLQPTPIAYRVIRKVFARLGVHYDVESSHLKAICAIAAKNGGKATDLPFGYVAVNDYGKVTIEQQSLSERTEFCFPFKTGVTQTPFGKVEISKAKLGGALRVDLNKIPSTAVLRNARPGDVFTKFGGGTKPLNRYLIDKKIPARRRNGLCVIAVGNVVLAICAVEIADSVKVAEGSDVWYVKYTSPLMPTQSGK